MPEDGRARGVGRSLKLKAGSLLFIEKNEPRQIMNTGAERLVTIYFYSSPAYTHGGDIKRSVQRK